MKQIILTLSIIFFLTTNIFAAGSSSSSSGSETKSNYDQAVKLIKSAKKIEEKYSKIVEKHSGDIVKLENWGLMNLSYLIKKNKKGNYIHFKIKGNGEIISELEKNEKIDKNLLRYLTVKVNKFDLETDYFKKSEEKFDVK